jgi:hypothetical protein
LRARHEQRRAFRTRFQEKPEITSYLIYMTTVYDPQEGNKIRERGIILCKRG